MKKGYKKLLLFEVILLIVLILNSFVWNILNEYGMVVFLLISIMVFKLLFGFEKDRHRYIKDIIFELLIVLLVSFLLYYLFGILIGFYKANNYYTFNGIKTFILPTILFIVLKEFLRYQILTKSEGSKLLIIATTLLFIFLDISTTIYYENLTTMSDMFMFIALTFLPSVSNNIVCSYISSKFGYKPNILWLLVTDLYIYLLPIIPNPNEYILSIIRFVFPFIIAYRVYLFIDKAEDKEIDRDYNKTNKLSLIFPTIVVVTLVYFTSGYFNYYALAIASGSMEPNIHKGDVVVVEKIEDKFSSIEEGEVIAYKYGDVIVVHRVVNIVEDNGEYYFYTKGDANTNEDNYAIREEMVIGVVNFRIPYIGLPTVWFNEL